MAHIETEIWLALKDRIETIPGGLFIHYPGAVVAPTDAPFLAVGRVTARPDRVMISRGQHWLTGSITVSYVAPIGQDQSVYIEQGGIIAAHFPEDLRMKYGAACVRVVSYPHVIDGYRDGAWWRTPVNIRWRCAA